MTGFDSPVRPWLAALVAVLQVFFSVCRNLKGTAMSAVLILVIVPIVSMLVCYAVAKKRNAKVVRWVILAACIGPLAIPLVFYSKPQTVNT